MKHTIAGARTPPIILDLDARPVRVRFYRRCRATRQCRARKFLEALVRRTRVRLRAPPGPTTTGPQQGDARTPTVGLAHLHRRRDPVGARSVTGYSGHPAASHRAFMVALVFYIAGHSRRGVPCPCNS